MKIGSITNIGYDLELLDGCLQGLQFLDKRVIVASSKSYQGGISARDNDVLYDIADRNKAHVINTDMAGQEGQRNLGLEQMRDFDWVMIVDVDEWYDEGMASYLRGLFAHLKGVAYKVKFKHFFRYANYFVDSSFDSGSIFLVKPSVKFIAKRNIDSPSDFINISPYHFSYVRSPEVMKEKLRTFSHADEIVDGFYDMWLNFDGSQEKLHPTNPPIWLKSEAVSLPEDIMRRLPDWAIK
jgi:hypothetical protein